MTVADLLVKSGAMVQGEASLDAVSAILLESGRDGVPVVDERGYPLGVVTRADCLSSLLDREDGDEREPPRVRLRDWMAEIAAPGLHTDRLVHSTAGEIMRPPSRVLPDRAPISMAVKALADGGGEPVLVLAGSGEVAGLLTPADVVEWLSRRLA